MGGGGKKRGAHQSGTEMGYRFKRGGQAGRHDIDGGLSVMLTSLIFL